MPNMHGRIARWVQKMAEYDYDLVYLEGNKNVVADALSRRADHKDEPAPDTLAAVRARRPQEPPAVAAANCERDKRAAELTLPPAADRPLPNKEGVIVTGRYLSSGYANVVYVYVSLRISRV